MFLFRWYIKTDDNNILKFNYLRNIIFKLKRCS